ncbi:MAG: hypothetical protein IPJ71_01235 [Bdellovibrionales bacterium]|nr:hypothetical protein [Bdellovibrionales bacterium]
MRTKKKGIQKWQNALATLEFHTAADHISYYSPQNAVKKMPKLALVGYFFTLMATKQELLVEGFGTKIAHCLSRDRMPARG